MTKKTFLDNAYELNAPEKTNAFYKDWASTYDEEVAKNGYASPMRCARVLKHCGAPLNEPVLDIGCGSGLSGEWLRNEGFGHLIGSDFSPEMLAEADRKGIYQALHLADVAAPFDFVSEPLASITAVGVLSPGHAGPDLVATALGLLKPHGVFVFTMNDHAFSEPRYVDAVNESLRDRRARLLWQDYGDHLPKIGLGAFVYALQRLD